MGAYKEAEGKGQMSWAIEFILIPHLCNIKLVHKNTIKKILNGLVNAKGVDYWLVYDFTFTDNIRYLFSDTQQTLYYAYITIYEILFCTI